MPKPAATAFRSLPLDYDPDMVGTTEHDGEPRISVLMPAGSAWEQVVLSPGDASALAVDITDAVDELDRRRRARAVAPCLCGHSRFEHDAEGDVATKCDRCRCLRFRETRGK